MLDPRLLRNDLDNTARLLARRGFTLDTGRFLALEEKRKALQVRTQELQAERNTRSKSIGKAKAAGEDIGPLLKEVEGLGEQLKAAEQELGTIQEELNDTFEISWSDNVKARIVSANQDNAYHHARIDPAHRYRIRGYMHSCEEFVLTLRAGFMHMETWGTKATITAFAW